MNPGIKKLINKVMDLAIDITLKTDIDVFVEYAGHVNGILVRRCEKHRQAPSKVISNLYLDDSASAKSNLKKVIKELEEIRSVSNDFRVK